ncbi:MAG: endolytic transglycosylase MltG [Desulfofustis sp.]|nr:endolytic transglycosylase MltG [Desulfofustis sp.]
MQQPEHQEQSAVVPKKRSKLRGALRASLFLLAAVVIAAGSFAFYALMPGPRVEVSHSRVFISKGASVEEIGDLLESAGLLDSDPRFLLLTRILGVASRLPAGEFILDTNQNPVDLLNQLVDAKPVQHQLTVVEGLTMEEIAELFAAAGWIDKDRFLALAGDPATITAFGLDGIASLEGYLFPDTYQLIKPSPGEGKILARLVNRALEVYGSLDFGNADLSRHQVFTLASIVEKETGMADERPVIASVFHNRLRKRMKLQSDPTVIYGIDGFNGPLTKKDLKTPTPYNTYSINGLPPGPICSPGRDSLQAVLTPADTNYLYFVSKNDGSHYFSASLGEHNRAVRKYQR